MADVNDTITLLGREIPRMGFGTLYVTEERGFGKALPHAVDLLREVAQLGIRLFDTADSYGNGAAEEAVKDALYPYKDLIITTKGGFRHERLGAWVPDGRPRHLRDTLEGSLRRLGLDCVDLYQLHWPDGSVPYADSVGTLADMQREGKIRHIGISNVGPREIETALEQVDVISVENAYNVKRSWENAVIDWCEANNRAFLPWMPLGDGSINWQDPVLVRVADKHECTAPQAALAALLYRSPVIIPIPGTSALEHLKDNMGALAIRLDEEDVDTLWR